MEIEPGLIVVNIEQCIPEALNASQCSEIMDLSAPNEISHSLGTLQPHQIEHLPSLHYAAQLHVGFDNSSSNSAVMSPLFPSPTLHFESNSLPEPYSDHYLASPSNLSLPDTSLPAPHPRISSASPSISPVVSVPKEKKRRTPVPNDVPKFPINQFEYYKEIEQLLASEKYPENASENYKIHLRKRAQNYLLIDNILYHNPKKPKKVIMKKENQVQLLEAAHVSDSDGVHLGIKKMYSLIHERFFWRCLYEDVSNYANSCPKCRDDVDVAQRIRPRSAKLHSKLEDDDSEIVDDLDISSITKLISSPSQTMSVIWKEVEIQIHGPFNSTSCRNEFIVTITDQESCFIQASPFKRAGYATNLTEFIVKTFYTFGFPAPYMVADKDLFNIVSAEYDWRLKQQFGKRSLTRREKAQCPWVSQLLDILVRRRPAKWDRELDRFMFQFRTGVMRKFNLPYKWTPFYSMFQRGSSLDEKENTYGPLRITRKSQNTFQCHTCDEVFTSRISFGIHTKRHLMEVPKEDNPLTDIVDGSKDNKKNVKSTKPKNFKDTVEVAMNELKKYLEKTKDDRRKRGKYQKFSVEVHEHMIIYALKHGNQKAASYFSQLLGTHVSGSTIRNLVKAQEEFQPRLKEEIAKYAVENGLDKASKHYTQLLKKEVSIPVVRRFKRIYGRKFIKVNERSKEEEKAIKANSDKISKLTLFEKDTIGEYSCEHSLNQTIKYFTKVLGIKLRDTDVETFQKAYIDKKAKESIEKLEKEKLGKPQETVSFQDATVTNGARMCFTAQPVVTLEPAYFENSVSYQCSTFSSEPNSQSQPMEVSEHFMLVSENDSSTYEITIRDQPVEVSPDKIASTEEWNQYEQRLQLKNDTYEIKTVNQGSIKKDLEILENSEDMLQESILLKENGEILQEDEGLLQTNGTLLHDGNALLQTDAALLDTNEELLHPTEEFSEESVPDHEELVHSEVKLINADGNLLQNKKVLSEHCRKIQRRENDLRNTEDLLLSSGNVLKVTEQTMLQKGDNKELISARENQKKELLASTSGTSAKSAGSRKSASQRTSPSPPKKKKKRKETRKKRGSYASYSPELRAEIGKYAAEHSSLKASDHFSKILGHDFPESTARGLKERYLAKVRHCDVSSLGYFPRGRPLRLGKYDELVQDCLKELVKSGEKASSFLAITTAKQIVTKFEPELLKENGGSVVLNETWAKSFLKRVGIRNNS